MNGKESKTFGCVRGQSRWEHETKETIKQKCFYSLPLIKTHFIWSNCAPPISRQPFTAFSLLLKVLQSVLCSLLFVTCAALSNIARNREIGQDISFPSVPSALIIYSVQNSCILNCLLIEAYLQPDCLNEILNPRSEGILLISYCLHLAQWTVSVNIGIPITFPLITCGFLVLFGREVSCKLL